MVLRLDDPQVLYSKADEFAFTGVEIRAGTEVEVGEEVIRREIGAGFCRVRLRNGAKGFIRKGARGTPLPLMSIGHDRVRLFCPRGRKMECRILRKNDTVRVLNAEGRFLRIQCNSGREGYILSGTQLEPVEEITRDKATRNILTGLCAIVSAIVSLVLYAEFSGAEMSSLIHTLHFVGLAFGALQLLAGLVQLSQARV